MTPSCSEVRAQTVCQRHYPTQHIRMFVGMQNLFPDTSVRRQWRKRSSSIPFWSWGYWLFLLTVRSAAWQLGTNWELWERLAASTTPSRGIDYLNTHSPSIQTSTSLSTSPGGICTTSLGCLIVRIQVASIAKPLPFTYLDLLRLHQEPTDAFNFLHRGISIARTTCTHFLLQLSVELLFLFFGVSHW